MRFRNTLNSYEETSSVPFLWALIFGPFYFVYKGVWRHAIFYSLANIVLISVAGFLAGGAGVLFNAALQHWAGAVPTDDPGRVGGLIGVVVAAFLLPFLIYPFFATGIVRRHYLRLGWEEAI